MNTLALILYHSMYIQINIKFMDATPNGTDCIKRCYVRHASIYSQSNQFHYSLDVNYLLSYFYIVKLTNKLSIA